VSPVSTPLYLDWSFWAVVVAAIAIILSQIPPIHILLKKARIDFELYSKISITHKVGNPNLELHLIITNIGGRKVRVKDIKASIERDGKSIVTLPAQNYLQNQNDQNYVLFTTFSLKPNDEWAHIVNFLNFFGREDEKEYRDLEGKMLADYRDKRSKLLEEPTSPIELNPELVKSSHDFFKKHFIWSVGEYLMKVNIITDQESGNITKIFRFTVFESHAEQLKAITDDFKYGGGIWWDKKTPTNVILEISEA